MEEQFVSDSTAIISLHNLRVVKKIDIDRTTHLDIIHLISCTYSDMREQTIIYEDKEARDSMFIRLADKLAPFHIPESEM